MAAPSIAVLLGKKDEPTDDKPSKPDLESDDDDYSDLSPEEIVEHQHAAAEAVISAIKEDSTVDLLKALKTLDSLFEVEKDGKPEDCSEEE